MERKKIVIRILLLIASIVSDSDELKRDINQLSAHISVSLK